MLVVMGLAPLRAPRTTRMNDCRERLHSHQNFTQPAAENHRYLANIAIFQYGGTLPTATLGHRWRLLFENLGIPPYTRVVMYRYERGRKYV